MLTSAELQDRPAATVPPRAVVRKAAAVTERYGLVGVSPEAPLFDLPAFPEWDDPAFVSAMNEPRQTTASAGQLVDNFLAATHLRTVHAGTFGVDDGGDLPPSETVRCGWTHTTSDVQYKNVDDPLVATGEHPLVQPQRLDEEIAGPTTAVVRLHHPLTGKTDKAVSTDLGDEVSVRSDRLSVTYRRILGELVACDAERGVA